jgi:hypothetical protein
VGIKGGVPVTDITEAQNYGGGGSINRNVPHRWTVGPMLEVDLPANFGVEVNALYRKVGLESFNPSLPPAFEMIRMEASDSLWDFPVLGKYRFSGELVRPYVGGGWTYRRLGDLVRFHSGSHGVVVGAGATIKAAVLRISPEFRYTRWPGNDILEPLKTRANQAEILVGLTF